MSKSNFFGPGANDVLNGTTIHFTSLSTKPSLPATAYATADSKPWPEAGLLTFHGDFSAPPNHGGNAGVARPTASRPPVPRRRRPCPTRFPHAVPRDDAEPH